MAENKFLAVYNPFPAMPRLDEKGSYDIDAIQLVQWLACVVGGEHIMSLYFKPRSPGIVIVEISEEFTEWATVLGVHKWENVFKKLQPAHTKFESKIYYSTFMTDREVHKTGWKSVKIKDSWLDGWDPADNLIVNYPYPTTVWCDVPLVEVGEITLCRHIPKIFCPGLDELTTLYKAAKAEPVRVVPGTTDWAVNRGATRPGMSKRALFKAHGGFSTELKTPISVGNATQGTSGGSGGSRRVPPVYSSVSEVAMRAIVVPEPVSKYRSVASTATRSNATRSNASMDDNISLSSSQIFGDSDEDDEYYAWTGGAQSSWGIDSAAKPVTTSSTQKSKKKSKGKAKAKEIPVPSWEVEVSPVSPDDVMQPGKFSWADDYDENCVAPTNALSDSGSDTETGSKVGRPGGYSSDEGTSIQDDESTTQDKPATPRKGPIDKGWDEPTTKLEDKWKCPTHDYKCPTGVCELAKANAKKVVRAEREKHRKPIHDDDGKRIWREPRQSKGKGHNNQEGARGRGQGRGGRRGGY